MKQLIFLLLASCVLNTNADSIPVESRVDGQIKFHDYDENKVFSVKGSFLRETMVQLNPKENISYVGVGDPTTWQVISFENYLVIKPIADDSPTNVNVITTHIETNETRRYAFSLVNAENDTAHNEETWQIVFRYPRDEAIERIKKLKKINSQNEAAKRQSEIGLIVPERKSDPTKNNHDYSLAGDMDISPFRVFDDGEFTYLRFRDEIDTPSMFMVNADGSEQLLDYFVRGKYVVVKRVVKQMVFRENGLTACLYNESSITNEIPLVD